MRGDESWPADDRSERPAAGGPRERSRAPGAKGLRSGAIGAISNYVIGVASTAPAYSMAATLGVIVGVPGIGLSAPAVLLVAFVPMLCIALAYYYMNRADPDCGTTFAWVTRAMGPQLGWINGWAIIAADVIVMASLSQIAGTYTFRLIGWTAAANSTLAVTIAGVAWIALMAVICLIGVELNARTQSVMLGAELAILVVFSIVALIKGITGHPPGHVPPTLSWADPFRIPSYKALIDGLLFGLFIYWGWDAGVAVNEEARDPRSGPGKAAVASTITLVLVFVLVSFAAQSYAGAHALAANSSDVLSFLGGRVFGSGWDKLLILAVLTSTAASTQTTILPTARTTLSMASWRALPRIFGEVHPRYQTPWFSTILMSVVSAALYVAMELLSRNVLADSITAIGFQIAFYYGFTGLACAIYYRRELRHNVKRLILAGVLPLLGFGVLAFVFVQAYLNYSKPGAGVSQPLLGIQIPIVLGVGPLLLGAALAAIGWATGDRGGFFGLRPEVASHGALGDAGDASSDRRLLGV